MLHAYTIYGFSDLEFEIGIHPLSPCTQNRLQMAVLEAGSLTEEETFYLAREWSVECPGGIDCVQCGLDPGQCAPGSCHASTSPYRRRITDIIPDSFYCRVYRSGTAFISS
jgi:hypothetical protein